MFDRESPKPKLQELGRSTENKTNEHLVKNSLPNLAGNYADKQLNQSVTNQADIGKSAASILSHWSEQGPSGSSSKMSFIQGNGEPKQGGAPQLTCTNPECGALHGGVYSNLLCKDCYVKSQP